MVMFFKSYDGWKAVKSDENKIAVLAQFTKADGEVTHYVLPALRRLLDRNPEATDKALLQAAITDGPTRLKSFDGWHGRILLAHFMTSSGARRYNLSSLYNMQTNPPRNFSPSDKVLLAAAIDLKR